jgi:predicted histidine transporter YuiF (NhaC family)
MNKKHLAVHIIEILAGVILLGLGIAGKVDEFWSGMGGALIGVGAMRMTQIIRYQKNEEYRENKETQRNDERNQFLHMKAWQFTGFWFVMIAAIATFAFKFAGKEDLMMLSSGSVCTMMVMYWIFYLYLRKKY